MLRRGGSDAPARSAAVSTGNGQANTAAGGRKRQPTAETNAEVFYYKKQIETHTPMIIVLQDGEEIEGTIEWYDRSALKVNRKSAPNIMLLKHNIKYMFKAEDREPE
jgi:sRNA-binding regulator protein Hfq